MPAISNVMDKFLCRLSPGLTWPQKMPARPQLRRNSVTGKPQTNCRGAHVSFPFSASLAVSLLTPAIAGASRPTETAGHHFLRRRPRQRAVAEEPRDGGEERRAFHLFPLLHLPDEPGEPRRPIRRRTRNAAAPMSALPRATTRSASASAISGTPISKATTSPAMPAAISTAGSGARPTGRQEYATFHATLKNAWKGVDLEEPAGWQDLVDHGIQGFRAPYLSATAGADMIAAEKKAGFSYDASLVTKGPAMPVEEDGIIRFGLPLIPEGPREKPIIGMDYNLFVRHSKGEEDKADSEGIRRPRLRRLQGGFRQAICRRPHSAAARLPFRRNERRRLLAGARPAGERRLPPPGRRLRQLFRSDPDDRGAREAATSGFRGCTKAA
jgi:hypothetical protein